MANVQDSGVEVSSNSSPAIKFTLGLMSLGKARTPYPTSYELNSITAVPFYTNGFGNK